MRRLPTITLSLCISMHNPVLATSQDGQTTVKTTFEAGLNLVAEDNLFWKLPSTFAPNIAYSRNTTYLEEYIKPGVKLQFKRPLYTIYGRGSVVLSHSTGTDPYNEGNTGRATLEEGYVGIKTNQKNAWNYDLSVGARTLKFGSGMLISNGGTSGFERGALKLGPRKAWERSIIARLSRAEFNVTGYYIDPNELDSNNTDTRLYGFDINAPLFSNKGRWGMTFGHVIRSRSPYPKAAPGGAGAPTILENGRDGLNFVNHYGHATLYEHKGAFYFSQWDGAYQWNNNIDLRAWGGRIRLGSTYHQFAWQPTLLYSWQTFSGDNPNTNRLERFDPLYFEGSPSAWSTGSKSSMVFINTNVYSHQLSLSLLPHQQHQVKFRLARINVNELKSPIQFGQASRLDFSDGISTVISGVTQRHLADDMFIEYTYIASQSTYVTLGISKSIAGDAITSTTDSYLPHWIGGFANIVMFW